MSLSILRIGSRSVFVIKAIVFALCLTDFRGFAIF